MTKRILKQQEDAGSVAVMDPDESELDVRGANIHQPEEVSLDRNESGPRTSTTQQGTQQFVVFIAGEEVFAADMTPVKEIIRVPDVVRVPLAPAALEGLANLRGKVLPIISLRRLFGFPELAHDDSTRALVVDVGQPLGFVVDRVSSVVGVDANHIEDVGSIRTTVNTEVLSGLLKDVGGHPMIMVLDFLKLIEKEFTHGRRGAGQRRG
jgi:purine-binding chemotaxis protein CheW